MSTLARYPFSRLRSLDLKAFEGAHDLDLTTLQLAACSDHRSAKSLASDQLTMHLLKSKEKRKSGATHLVNRGRSLSPQLIATAAVHILHACYGAQQPPPAELVHLFAVLHNLEVRGRGQLDSEESWCVVATYVAMHPKASLREIAKAADVSVNTVRAWRRQPRFDNWVRMCERAITAGYTPIWLPARENR